MSKMTGPYKALQAAVAPAAASTWYATTNTITGVQGSNVLRLYVAGTVASLGNVDFYLTHVHPGDASAVAYTRCAAGDGPEVFGPIPFTAAGENFFIDIPIGLPTETIQVYYRVGSVASNPQIAIVGCCYLDESGTSNAEISVGDIEVDVAALEVLSTAANALLTTIDADTGTIAGDTTSIDGKTPALGSAAMAAAVPVTLASDDTNTVDLPNVIGTDGSAGPTKCLSVGGTDAGGVIQELSVDTVGQVRGAGAGWLQVHGSDDVVDFTGGVATSALLVAGTTYNLCATEDCHICATTIAADDATTADTPLPAWTIVPITVPTDEATNLYISVIAAAVGGYLHISAVDY